MTRGANTPDLSGKVVVVAGAAGAAGPAAVRHLAECGAVVVAAGRSAERLQPVVSAGLAAATGRITLSGDSFDRDLFVRDFWEYVEAGVGRWDVRRVAFLSIYSVFLVNSP